MAWLAGAGPAGAALAQAEGEPEPTAGGDVDVDVDGEGDGQRPRSSVPSARLQAPPPPVPPFLADQTLTLRLRTQYANIHTLTAIDREAWALGGWIAWRSGWLADALRVGATYYGSAPAYAPPGRDGTQILAPGQLDYWVLGEAFAALRWREAAQLTGWRQLVAQPYIDPLDNRMTPQTFEGLTLGGRLAGVSYDAGWLSRIKLRNADRFIPMSEAAGAPGTDRGVAFSRVAVEPLRGLAVTVAEQYGVDTFNTLFGQVEHAWPLGGGTKLLSGLQLTDQRSVGDVRVAPVKGRDWVTRNGSAQLALAAGPLTLRAAGSVTATGNRIQSPWGLFPGYARLNFAFFNNAGERALTGGATYDLSRLLVSGLAASLEAGRGVGSVNPANHAPLPDHSEVDLTVLYAPRWSPSLRLRLLGLRYREDGVAGIHHALRLWLSWDLPLVRSPERIIAAAASPAAPPAGGSPRSAGPDEADPAGSPR